MSGSGIYGYPTAAATGAAPSQQRGAKAAATGRADLSSVGGVLFLLFAAVAVAIIFHILGVRFFVEVRR